MITIALLLYLADVIEGIKSALIVFNTIIFLGLGLFTLLLLVNKQDINEAWSDIKNSKRFFIANIALVCTFTLLTVLIPSKNTIYGITALYVGKEIIESRLGQKSTEALETILDRIIQKQ